MWGRLVITSHQLLVLSDGYDMASVIIYFVTLVACSIIFEPFSLDFPGSLFWNYVAPMDLVSKLLIELFGQGGDHRVCRRATILFVTDTVIWGHLSPQGCDYTEVQGGLFVLDS